MTFATLTNIVTMIFCLAVLVQSVRMMRSLKTVQDGALSTVVDALDQATGQARAVLHELKATLGECAGSQRMLREGKDMAEELSVMIGIADASAERLMDASRRANGRPADAWDPVSDYVDIGYDDANEPVAREEVTA